MILLVIAGYVAVFRFLTSRRSQVTRGTLALGAGLGLLLGMVMYLVAPLGLGNDATDPWLPGSRVDPLVALHGTEVAAYFFMMISFPVIGLIMSSLPRPSPTPHPASPIRRVTAAGSRAPGPARNRSRQAAGGRKRTASLSSRYPAVPSSACRMPGHPGRAYL